MQLCQNVEWTVLFCNAAVVAEVGDRDRYEEGEEISFLIPFEIVFDMIYGNM